MDNLKVLIIEDNKFYGELLTTKIKAINSTYYVELIDSYKEIIKRKIQPKEFDVMIIDYIIPGKNGLELLDEFRNTGIDKPVILITSLKDTTIKTEAIKRGASGFMLKPINYDGLYSLINEVVEKKNIHIE